MFQPSKISDEIKNIIIDAGNMLVDMGKSDRKIQTKSDGSPVTEIDKALSDYLQNRLTNLFPEAGWLSEESKDDSKRLDAQWVWIVDPLDGTKEFIQNVPEFSISIGLCHKGIATLGAVYNPATGEGAVGDITNNIIRPWGITKTFSEQVIPVSRTEFSKPKMQTIAHKLAEYGFEVIPIGSVAYKLLRVATGINSLTFSMEPKSEWDICGGVALLNAAGFAFKRFDGKPIRFNNANTLYNTESIGGKNHLVAKTLLLLKEMQM